MPRSSSHTATAAAELSPGPGPRIPHTSTRIRLKHCFNAQPSRMTTARRNVTHLSWRRAVPEVAAARLDAVSDAVHVSIVADEAGALRRQLARDHTLAGGRHLGDIA